jgi:TetR/AcrR family transcriptional regulator, transcriptional repressor for nem operon
VSAPTRSQLLAEAETLIRRDGYAAFSYAHLAEKIGITKASIHYHFPTKQRLAEEVADSAMSRFADALAEIEAAHADAPTRLQHYSELFLDGFDEQLRPPCCALAAELAALPAAMHAKVRRYFDLHLEWLTRIIEAGIRAGELGWQEGAARLASLLLTTLEGGSLVGRARQTKADVQAGFVQVLKLAAV